MFSLAISDVIVCFGNEYISWSIGKTGPFNRANGPAVEYTNGDAQVYINGIMKNDSKS